MKFKTFLTAHKGLVRDVVTSTCLLGGSAGIVFGVSAASFKIEYMDLTNADNRLAAALGSSYSSQDINSQWNIPNFDMPTSRTYDKAGWISWHPGAQNAPCSRGKAMEIEKEEGSDIGSDATLLRKQFTSLIIDGASHSALDRSFNQSLLEGCADFIQNRKLDAYNLSMVDTFKPSQDNNAEFINIYQAVMNDPNRFCIGLAGFNHASPLQNLMTSTDPDTGLPICVDPKNNANAQKTAFILLDAAVPGNQCVASVLFRSDQPGFLTGLATGEYLINNLHMYHDHYQDLAVAEYGGVAIPTVTIYMGGFQRGIELFNESVIKAATSAVYSGGVGSGGAYFYLTDTTPQTTDKTNIQLLKTFKELLVPHTKYANELEEIKSISDLDQRISQYNDSGLAQRMYDEFSIKMIKLGDSSNHFSGTFAAGDAIGITKQYLNRGASAIICVAGPQSLDTAQEIQNQKSKAIVIGVDTAMENSDYQRYHAGCSANTPIDQAGSDVYWDHMKDSAGDYSAESHAIIKFSAIKDLKTVTNKINRLVAKGENWDVSLDGDETKGPHPMRSICGPGFQTCGNIQNGLISISWDGFVPLIEALKNIPFYKYDADPETETEKVSFEQAWADAVAGFSETESAIWATLSDEYKNNIIDITKAERFSKFNPGTTEESIFHKYYNITTQILGYFLNTTRIKLDTHLTLEPTGGGFIKLPEGEVRYRTVLDWLNINMYFTC